MGPNLRVAVPCLVDPLGSFGFQSCTAYAAKQRWNNGGEMWGNKQTRCTNCSIFAHSRMHTVSTACVNTRVDSTQAEADCRTTFMNSRWRVCECVWVQLSTQNDPFLIISTSEHLVTEEKSQAQTQSTEIYKRRENVLVCWTLASNQRRLRNQR